ncbi:hypothetical protein NECAME_05095 [Necator americanus]|uniref:Uncharacterized protein n=1 Tax=Necator americanus TaxID=51031 RepID=W2SJT7_NECAM|nr:hypothetical protein NECAME_05095 [Necator americanus]ETN69909.1 hypothetical protein NECAME_05095 [Necator americanus]
MDNLTEEWSSSEPQLYDLVTDVKDIDFELSDQLKYFLRLRNEVIDPTRHTVRHCMRFQQHCSENGFIQVSLCMSQAVKADDVDDARRQQSCSVQSGKVF